MAFPVSNTFVRLGFYRYFDTCHFLNDSVLFCQSNPIRSLAATPCGLALVREREVPIIGPKVLRQGVREHHYLKALLCSVEREAPEDFLQP